MAWDTKKGFYVSTVVLDAPWEEEVTGVETRVGEHINPTTIHRRGFDDKITYNNFKSLDGSPWTKPARKDRGEMPDDFIWTQLIMITLYLELLLIGSLLKRLEYDLHVQKQVQQLAHTLIGITDV